ncbi:MAG TPA: glycosyltransferase family 87 protein [Gemmatales bacterium]|nr:glycosyltransferase family 87 protein [Gemmatales bacterium]
MNLTTVSTTPLSRILNWLRTHPITLITSCIMLGYLVTYLASPNSPWTELYVRAADQMVHGKDMYEHKLGFAYPPARALLIVPFLALPAWGQQVAWWMLNVVCLVLLCQWMWKLAGGLKLEPVTKFTANHFIWLAGILTGIFYVFNGLSNQATDLVEAVFMIAGCVAMSSRRVLLAAAMFGIAAGLKATPFLFCLYLLWHRQWLATLWMIAVAVGINLLPDLISQCPTASTWLGGWINTYLVQFQNPNYTPGSWGTLVYYNQALAGMMSRMFLYDWTWSNGSMQLINLTPALPPMVYKLGLLGVQAVLLAICVLGFWRGGSFKGTTTAPIFSYEPGLEYSMVLMLMVLFSPVSSKSHFCILILPGMMLAKVAWEQRSKAIGTLFIVANLIGFIALTWWGEYVARVSLYYGAVTIKTLLLLAGCAVALSQLRAQQKAVVGNIERSETKLAA